MPPQEFDVLAVIDFENPFARPETPYKYLRRLLALSVNQDMIIPKWLFELPIIKPERNEFQKNDRVTNFDSQSKVVPKQ